jgi:hypothetical protein
MGNDLFCIVGMAGGGLEEDAALDVGNVLGAEEGTLIGFCKSVIRSCHIVNFGVI